MPYNPLKYWQRRKNPSKTKHLLDFEERHIKSFLKNAEHLLDFGMGTGRTFEAYPPGLKVTGIDIVDQYHDSAVKRAKIANLEYVHFICREPMIPFRENYFSHAIACKVFLHITQPWEYLMNLARVAEEVLIIDTTGAGNQKAQHVRVHDFEMILNPKFYQITSWNEQGEHLAITYRKKP